jgi:hypothetical protein
MLENLLERAELIGFARRQAKAYDTKTVPVSQVEDAEKDGWVPVRKKRKSVRLQKEKKRSVLLESRVWTLFFRMGFT